MSCTYGYSHFIHFNTVVTKVEIQSTLIMFHLCCHSLEVPFSLLKKGVTQYFCPYNGHVRIEKSPVQTVAIKLEAHNSLEYHYMLKH